MSNPRVTVILSSELATLLNAERERNPLSDRVTTTGSKIPRSMSEILASAALTSLRSDSLTVGRSDDGTVGPSDDQTVGPSDKLREWVKLACEILAINPSLTPTLMTEANQEDLRLGVRKVCQSWGIATRALEAYQDFARRHLADYSERHSAEEVIKALDDCWEAFETRDYSEVVGALEAVTGQAQGLKNDLAEVTVRNILWNDWAKGLLGIHVNEPVGADELRESVSKLQEASVAWNEWAMGITGDASLDTSTAQDLQKYIAASLDGYRKQYEECRDRNVAWNEWAMRVIGSEVPNQSAEELRAALQPKLDQLQAMKDPRFESAPEWLTPERAATFLLDLMGGKESNYKSLQGKVEGYHPEWFPSAKKPEVSK